MTEKQKKMIPMIYDAINPETNARHEFVAGTIYARAMSQIIIKAKGENK